MPAETIAVRVAAAIGVSAALASGCSGAAAYGFAPAEPVGTPVVSIAGIPTTSHAVPAERPRGRVRVAVTDTDADGVHVRLGIVHDGDGPAWSVDLGAQHLVLARAGTVLPARSGTDSDVVVIPPGASAVLDLYFPLRGCTDAGHPLQAFDVVWQVDAGRRVTGVDHFERIAGDHALASSGGELASGPEW
jgi:hypothetical protein